VPGDGAKVPPLRFHTDRVRIVILDRRARRQNAQSPRRWFPGMTCAICGEGIRQWQAFNHDHQLPMAKGGAKGRKNKQYTHVLCNSVKGDRYPFSLRTQAEREAVRNRVRPETYAKLQRIWAGETA